MTPELRQLVEAVFAAACSTLGAVLYAMWYVEHMRRKIRQ